MKKMMKRLIVRIFLVGLLLTGTAWIGRSMVQKGTSLTPAPYTSLESAIINSDTEPSADTDEVGTPRRLLIPKLNLEASIEPVGMDENRQMEVPAKAEDVAWFEPGYIPGERGNSVIAGHFDTADGDPAVFYMLSQLIPGDEVKIIDSEGDELSFTATHVSRYSLSEFPMEAVKYPFFQEHFLRFFV